MKSNGEEIDSMISLFQLYEKKMYHIAFSILHDSYQAEDAVMNAFEKMLSKGYAVDDPESDAAKALVIRVTRSAAIDLYRINKWEQERVRLSEEPAQLPEADVEFYSEIQERDAAELISSLPPTFRECLSAVRILARNSSVPKGLLI